MLTLTHRFDSDGSNPVSVYYEASMHNEEMARIELLLQSATESMERQRFKEALRSIMGIAQLGNSILQRAEPWAHIKQPNASEAKGPLSSLAMSWIICRGLAVTLRPFMPFQSDRLWGMLGEDADIDSILWEEAFTYPSFSWNPDSPTPLFERLDLDTIMQFERSLVESNGDSNGNEPEPTGDDAGGDYIDFEDFMKVQLRTGRIISVEDHPNADKLYVIKIDEGNDSTRTLCAGLKGHYEPAELEGMDIVFVANLAPRKLRGILSEGMLLAADDEDGNVRVLTPESDVAPGSVIR